MTGDDRLGFARTVDDWLRTLAARNLRPRSVDAYRRILYAAIDLIGEQRDPRTLTINTLYRVGRQWRAAVSVDWRGGLRCRLVEPPYIPNADA